MNENKPNPLDQELQRRLSKLASLPVDVSRLERRVNAALADCLVVRKPFAPAAKAGEACEILRLRL